MDDLIASFQIFLSNMRASYGVYISAVIALLLLLFVLHFVRRANRLKHQGATLAAISPPAPNPARKARALESLQHALTYRTTPGEKQQMDELNAYLKTRYPTIFQKLDCMVMPGGSMLLRYKAQNPKGAKPAMFCGHLDVAPALDQGWAAPPFNGERLGGFVYGRGALDCKGVVIAQLEALESLVKEGHKPRRDLYFAYGSDEETGGEQGAMIIGSLLEKRGVEFELILDEGGFIEERYLGENGFPAALIGVCEKGACNLRLTAEGEGGNAGAALRQTPLGVIAEAICRIEAASLKPRLSETALEHLMLCAPALSFFDRLCLTNLKALKGVLLSRMKRRPVLGPLFRSTMVATQASGAPVSGILPQKAEATIHCRLCPGDTARDMFQYISSLLVDLPVEVELLGEEPPSRASSTKSEQYALLCRAIDERLPQLRCLPTMITGSTDAAHYAGLSDNIFRFSPFIVDEKTAKTPHGAGERVHEDSLGEAVEFYRVLLSKL